MQNKAMDKTWQSKIKVI